MTETHTDEVPMTTDPDMSDADREAVEIFNDLPDDDEPTNRSIEDMADDPTIAEEEDGQLFVMENERRVTLGTLIRRNTPVVYEFKLGGKAIKGGGDMGLIGFADPDITLIVPARAGKVEIDPTYEPDGTVKKVTIRAHVKPLTAYDARTEAGRAALNGE